METKPEELNLQNLTILKVLGKGAMGTVFLVTDQSSPSPFALKVVQKSTFKTKFDADRRARWEISVLSRLSKSPFLPSLLGILENEDFLAWGVPYCSGGDLNVLRYRQNDRIFSPTVIRFYVAEIVCALENLHRMEIVYRDLKPENVLIQGSGHITLTDFDLSRTLTTKPIIHKPVPVPIPKPVPEKKKHSSFHFPLPLPLPSQLPSLSFQRHRRNLTRVMFVAPQIALKKAKSARVSPVSRKRLSFVNGERSHSFVGTEEYVSPEVVRGEGHEYAVDWWALGILIYEMMYGKTPFCGKNRKETFNNVVNKNPEFLGKRTPLIDLIERLLDKDPTKRLGFNRGAVEIKEHEFFKGLRWDMLTDVMRPPFITPNQDSDDLTANKINMREYFRPKPVAQESPLDSPSVSLAEF
ncbi:hypothetical protein ACHQM5_018961 [Ranunculus cassubicifolius]